MQIRKIDLIDVEDSLLNQIKKDIYKKYNSGDLDSNGRKEAEDFIEKKDLNEILYEEGTLE